MSNKAISAAACAILIALLAGCATGGSKVEPEEEIPARAPKLPLFLVHYMPWFEAPPISNTYGWHWHMGSTDPFERDHNGRRLIASHYYPLTGPYDGTDPALLEYQVLLMKIAGIDGVIVDWYGISSSFDFPGLHRSTQALFAAVKKAGLKFAVCYEDQSVGRRVESKEIGDDKAVDAANADFAWMEQNWLRDEAYLKIAGYPVVLCFGPQYLRSSDQWKAVLDGLAPRPLFVTLDGNMAGIADGGYPWPPMWASVGGKLSMERVEVYLDEFYRLESASPFLVTTAFPGFHDFYGEARVRPSYGFLDDADGETFRSTLELAVNANPDVIQIATWNDFGEGTMIEPTVQKGFRELESLQALRRRLQPSFPFAAEDLRVPLEVFRRRVGQPAARDTARLDALSAAVVKGDAEKYRALLSELGIAPETLPVSTPVRRDTEQKAAAAAAATPAADPYAEAANIARGKPVRANNHIYEFTADKALDGEVRTYWEGAAKSYPNQITVDLGERRALAAIRIKLNPQRIWGPRTQVFTVLASGDGQEFAPVVASAGYRFDPASNANTVTVPLPSVTTRFLRLSFSDNDGATGGQIAELEVFGN